MGRRQEGQATETMKELQVAKIKLSSSEALKHQEGWVRRSGAQVGSLLNWESSWEQR